MNFLNNKYTKWYFKLIDAYRNKSTGYCENHHIVPSAMGGSDDLYNIARVSARVHFICHLLLVKMTEGENRNKMICAAKMMTVMNDQQSRYKVTSRQYAYLKEAFSTFKSHHNAKLWADPDFRAKMLTKWTDERRALYSKLHRDRIAKDPIAHSERTRQMWQDPDYVRKMTDSITNARNTEEQRELSSKNSTKLWQDPNYRAKLSKPRSNTTNMKWSPERRARHAAKYAALKLLG